MSCRLALPIAPQSCLPAQRLAAAEAELAAERSARAKLEEDMKRAFMRGVCALNIEASAHGQI